MFLRSVTLRGFKSFADKTTLEFTPGISVIVGPNGSGKSNIVDAIAWVLGEQGPRALRGGQMADVIFAGSPNRPALGMAEVRLVIDNEAGLIPVPASEIEISRTVFRSGDSEYRLGGRPCRLMDIQELLSDTGVGRALHTIVGQGHLDEVLTARPEERRQLIEEAAGIAKHRRRRERAERKLAGLEGDLLRLQDVVAELRRQLRPLQQQAALAERHDTLTTEATDLAVLLAAARLKAMHQERDRRRPTWEEAEARQEEVRARLSELDQEIARLDGERSEAEGTLRAAEDAHSEAQRAKSEGEASLRTAMREEARATERLTEATGRSGRLFALEEELERTERAVEDVGATLTKREGELQEGETAFRRAEQARRDGEAERRELTESAAARRAESEALRWALAGHEAEMVRLAASLTDVRGRAEGAAARAAELEAQIEDLDARETPLAKELAAAEKERSDLGRSVAELEAEEKGLLARQEMVQSREAELAESAAQAFARGRPGRAIGVLRELVEGPPQLRPAVRAALGPFADAVVYADRAHAVADATASGAGGLVLAVEAVTTGEDGPAPPRISGERPLIEAVRPDPRVGGLAATLLGRVYLVNNLAEAAAKHRVHRDATFVTPEGALVGPLFVRGATGPDERLDHIRRDSAALERELASVRRRLREGRARMSELAARTETVRAELEELDAEITAAADQQGALTADLAGSRKEEELLAERAGAVEAAAEAVRARLPQAAPEPPSLPVLPPLPEPPVHLRVEVEALRRERSRLEAGVARARRDIAVLSAEDPLALRRARDAAAESRAAAEVALRAAEEGYEGALREYRAATEQARGIRTRHDEANRTWRGLSASAERMREEYAAEDRARLDLERRLGEAERLLREGHDAQPAEAVARLAPDDTVEELQRRSEMVARRLALLGRVNLLAVGELGAVKERHDFLVREMEDVKAARRDLREVIAEIDVRIAQLFEAAFRDVSTAFTSLFAQLFPGGEGRLSLLDPGDAMGSGIEIEARPGGKRVRRLSLLSGGERSLAALAFLFAIFRARPSPFYLMDEVEAALDDVNLHRFLDVIKTLAERSQVLVVTHQKRTMEMADVLYGISMGQGGASTVISQRLAEVAAG